MIHFPKHLEHKVKTILFNKDIKYSQLDRENFIEIIVMEEECANNETVEIKDDSNIQDKIFQTLEIPLTICYVLVHGGLGNQLFQIAAALNYSKLHNKRLKLLTKGDEIRGYHWNKTLSFYKDYLTDRLLENTYHYKEPFFNYKELPRVDNNIFLEGYFQSLKYFPNIKLNVKLNAPAKFNSNVVVVHARRGDYCTPQNINIHNPQKDDYYWRAKEIMNDKIKDPEYLLLSDDSSYWENSAVFKDQKCKIINTNMYDTFDILCSSQNYIMSNSTFAWWGVYLSEHVNVVIAPKGWFGPAFRDNWSSIYIDGWIII